MELMRLGPAGQERPAVRADGVTYSLTSLTDEINGEFLNSDGIDRVRSALAAGQLRPLEDAGQLRVGSPIARPTAVICIGQNYAAHAAESGSEPPERPIIFFKHPNTVIGPHDAVTIPAGSTTTDWEVELGIVIGKTTARLSSPVDATAHIAGWTVADDVLDRSLQIQESGGQWSKGKSCPSFCPLGPALIPVGELSADALQLRSWVNGNPRQDSNTADMIFSPGYLVHDISQYITLEPGDLILTGTPEGVALSGRFPYLSDGDVVEVEIDGIGRQRHTFIDGR